MLEGQAGPVAIRDIVSVFKDRIHSERDKSEFKALCDKWTGVVEYPAGRWVCGACCGSYADALPWCAASFGRDGVLGGPCSSCLPAAVVLRRNARCSADPSFSVCRFC